MDTEQPLNVLIIDDDENALDRISQELMDTFGNKIKTIKMKSFADAPEILTGPSPVEVVILDLFEGEELEGQKIWELIWKKRLIPVAIHTAREWDSLRPRCPLR